MKFWEGEGRYVTQIQTCNEVINGVVKNLK